MNRITSKTTKTSDTMTAKRTKNTKLLLLVTVVALMAVTIPSAFAVESFPDWSTHQARPNGEGCSGNCYADSNANGVNHVYSKSTGIGVIHTAQAHNNIKKSPIVTTPVLELTTSNSRIGMEVDVVYKGSMTTGFGSVATFETGLDLYKNIFGGWYRVSGCGETLDADDDLDDSLTLSCVVDNVGENTYRAGATHKAHTQNWNIWTTTIVDFHDSGSNDSDKAETDRLELCHGAC